MINEGRVAGKFRSMVVEGCNSSTPVGMDEEDGDDGLVDLSLGLG